MSKTLEVGATFSVNVLVDESNTIQFMGERLRVYATPSMVWDVEKTCRDWLVSHLTAGEDSVGARVVIDHLGPTLLGQTITVAATVTELALPRVTFEVEVRDELDVVGRGTHVRFVVDKDRQAQRLAKKADRLAAR